MARVEIPTIEATAPSDAGADVFYQLGILYSAGGEIAADFVVAHKWFNIAASKGSRDAIRLRREIADQMSDAEIAAAQRAARDWMKPAPLKAA